MKSVTSILVAILILNSVLCNAQKDSSGIYFTAHDYLKQRLSFAINCSTQKHKIKADMIFHADQITIKHQDSTYTYPKDTVYGIKYCDGSVVRIYKRAAYPLINPGEEIQIYEVVSGTGMKNSPIVTSYYFSKNAESEIQPLTIYNLKAAFPDNHKFHDMVDMTFHENEELRIYDQIHRMMKVNRVLNASR